ncbi:nucleoside hydrolase [Aggregatilineales bacterium SYSU G02658]
MRHLLIDTDTASDDVVAIIMALREPTVQVEAITVVAGNLPLDYAVRNALIAVEEARTYAPPVYRGVERPFLRPLLTAESVHGQDGLGDMNHPPPRLQAAPGHAVDALIDAARRFPHQLEIVTLGPLMNLALACLKAPEIVSLVQRVTVMGGAGFGRGNVTPTAEFNLYVDAEAAQIVLNSGLPLTFVGWDMCTEEAFLSADELDELASSSDVAAFCVRCNATLRAFNQRMWGKDGIDFADPVAMAVALDPSIMTDSVRAYGKVEHQSELTYGQLVIDTYHLLKCAPNATFARAVDGARFKALLRRLIA